MTHFVQRATQGVATITQAAAAWNTRDIARVATEDLKYHLNTNCLDDPKKIYRFILRGANPNVAQEKTGITVLHYYAGKLNAPMVKFLLDNKANPIAKESRGHTTPLHYMIYFLDCETISNPEQEEKIQDIIQAFAQADVTVFSERDVQRNIPLHVICNKTAELFFHLFEERAPQPDTTAALIEKYNVFRKQLTIYIQSICRNTPNSAINAQNEGKETALHKVILAEKTVLSLLLRKGADPRIKNIFQDTPKKQLKHFQKFYRTEDNLLIREFVLNICTENKTFLKQWEKALDKKSSLLTHAALAVLRQCTSGEDWESIQVLNIPAELKEYLFSNREKLLDKKSSLKEQAAFAALRPYSDRRHIQILNIPVELKDYLLSFF